MITVYQWRIQAGKEPENQSRTNTKDFGNGFYCTIIKNKHRDGREDYDRTIVSIYDVLLDTKLDLKEFKEMTEDVAGFVLLHAGAESPIIMTL